MLGRSLSIGNRRRTVPDPPGSPDAEAAMHTVVPLLDRPIPAGVTRPASCPVGRFTKHGSGLVHVAVTSPLSRVNLHRVPLESPSGDDAPKRHNAQAWPLRAVSHQAVGAADGMLVGVNDRPSVGVFVGSAVGTAPRMAVGTTDGMAVGVAPGLAVGTADGAGVVRNCTGTAVEPPMGLRSGRP